MGKPIKFDLPTLSHKLYGPASVEGSVSLSPSDMNRIFGISEDKGSYEPLVGLGAINGRGLGQVGIY